MTRLQQLIVTRFLGFVQSDKPTGLSWVKAYEIVLKGGSVRRPTWRTGVFLSWTPGVRFLNIQNPTTRWLDKWTPYVDDFAATDWQIVTEPSKPLAA